MYFRPQPRALFRRRALEKWSENVVFWCVLMCFEHFDFNMCFAPQRRALSQLPKWSERSALCTFWLGNVLRAKTTCTFWTSQLPNAVRAWCDFDIAILTCASRHNCMHFLNISTSKSALTLECFEHFDLQRRALFRHPHCQNCSGREVF